MTSYRLCLLVLLLVYRSICDSHELFDDYASEDEPLDVYTSADYPKSGTLACAGPHKKALRHVCDPSGILSTAGRTRVVQKLATLEEHPKFPCGTGPDRGFQVGVALLERIHPSERDIAEFSRNIFNRWGIGHRECNNGVLLVLSKGDRKNYLKTGKGAREVLTDQHAADILASLRPELQSQQYDVAIEKAVDRIINEALSNGRPPFFYRLNDACFGVPQWCIQNPMMVLFSLALAFGVALCAAHSAYQERRKKQFIDKLRILQDARGKAKIMGSEGGNCCNAPCPICLEELTPDRPSSLPPLDFKDSAVEHGVELLACGHVFHHQCIEKWLKKANSCPICRTQKPRITGERTSENTANAQRPSVATPDDNFWSFAFENLTSNYEDVEGVRGTRSRMGQSMDDEADWFWCYNNVCKEERAARERAERERAAREQSERDHGGGSDSCDWGGGSCDDGGGAGGDW